MKLPEAERVRKWTLLQKRKRHRWYHRRYQSRLKQGKCPKCGEDRDSIYIICSSCREYSKLRKKLLPPGARNKGMRRYRNNCRRDRICYGCGSALREDPHMRCVRCREADRKRHMRAYVAKAIRGGSLNVTNC